MIIRHILFGYKLNKFSMDVLMKKGCSEDLLSQLYSIIDVPFKNKVALKKSLKKLLNSDDYKSHLDEIIEAARVLRIARLLKSLSSVYSLNFPGSKFIVPIRNYILSRPIPFTIWFRGRYCIFWLRSKLKRQILVKSLVNDNPTGYEYNKKQMQCFYRSHREQTEGLMRLLNSIGDFDAENSKILAVGPRNESEILLLRLQGFQKNNISSIDLFSYSPEIQVMDMNNMDYPENTFDVYYSSAVIKYSADVQRTVNESIRVVKPGGLIVYCFTFGTKSDIIPEGAEFSNGLSDLFALYGSAIKHIYWQQEHFVYDGHTQATVIFSIQKT